MNNTLYQPKWKLVEYSRSKISKAGKTIRSDTATKSEIDNAVLVIDNWRAAHAFPLHVIYIHLRRMCKENTKIIVAERLKRLDSIIRKLKLEKSMNLWDMQDLGGCRVIVPSVEEVYKYAGKYQESRKRHKFIKFNDYIQSPKPSGYRSLHYVYKYHSDESDSYNHNMLIEIQYRTHLQHLWATAVETMGVVTNQSIKSGIGTDEVKRFFLLSSALFAIKENQPLPPNVGTDLSKIVDEIKSLDDKYHFLNTLRGIRVAVDNQKDISKNKSFAYFILVLNYDTNMLQIIPFKASQIDEANIEYNSIEVAKAKNNVDAVLVRTSSFNALKKAYPNYFSDIGQFIKEVNSFLG